MLLITNKRDHQTTQQESELCYTNTTTANNGYNIYPPINRSNSGIALRIEETSNLLGMSSTPIAVATILATLSTSRLGGVAPPVS